MQDAPRRAKKAAKEATDGPKKRATIPKGSPRLVFQSNFNNSEEKLNEYALKAKIAADKYSGIFIIRGGKNRTNEGINSPRTTVVEFPDYNTAIKFYDSPEYQEALDVIKGHAVRHHQIVEGA